LLRRQETARANPVLMLLFLLVIRFFKTVSSTGEEPWKVFRFVSDVVSSINPITSIKVHNLDAFAPLI